MGIKLYLANVSCRENQFGRMVPYRLESFAGSWNDLTLKNLKECCKPSDILIDSGAFTFRTKNPNVDFTELTKRYAEFVGKNDFQQFLEMDVDNLIGFENVLRLRELLEREVGRKCIPVFHMERGRDAFVRDCETHPYVALGGIAKQVPPQRMDEGIGWMVKTAHDHGCKFHGLGMMSMNAMWRYGFDSCDASSWLCGGRYGLMTRFNGRDIVMDRLKTPKGKRLDYIKLDEYNLKEYLKLVAYARDYL